MKISRLHTQVCTLALLTNVGCAEGAASGVGLDNVLGSDAAAPVDDADAPPGDGSRRDGGISPPVSELDSGAREPGGRDAGSESGDAGPQSPGDPGTIPMPKPSCEPTSGCNAARYLGEISGDEASNSNLLMTTGKRSEWLTFRINEDSNSSRSLKATITLSGQGSANYDLFVYVPDDSSSKSCAGPTLSSSKAGAQPDAVSIDKSDAFISDDSRNVTIEVRHIDGDCEPYILDIRGP